MNSQKIHLREKTDSAPENRTHNRSAISILIDIVLLAILVLAAGVIMAVGISGYLGTYKRRNES